MKKELIYLGNKKLPIGVMDSGVGGLTVVKELINTLPGEDILYFGDSKRMPYGNKTAEEIIFLANKIISFLEAKGVKGILLACNTVSSQIKHLKSKVPIFGIIEAGCHAAIEISKGQDIGLIATVATVKSKVYEEILRDLAPEKRIVSNDSTRLPKIINDNLQLRELLDIHIKESIDPIVKNGNVQELILGCSHFPIIQKEIQELYPTLTLINPARKQVEMINKYLEASDLLNNGKSAKVEIFATDGLDEFSGILNRLELRDYTLTRAKLFEDD